MAEDAALAGEIDELYRTALNRFVPARNELAGRTDRRNAPAIRALQKPNVAAWALNQLYWRRRPTFDRVVEAAARLRLEQAAALLGRPNSLREAALAHRQALDGAVKEVTRLLDESGHPSTPDAARVITAALEALPWKEPAGRLVRPPSAPGFGGLAGMAVAQAPESTGAPEPAGRRSRPPESPRAGESPRPDAGKAAARARVATARAEAANAETQVRETREALERARDDERAAREAVEGAQQRLEAAESRRRDAERTERAAVRSLETARAAVARAEKHLLP